MLVKPTSSGDPAVDKALRDIRAAQDKVELLDGAQVIEDVALVTTAFKRIKHNLQRRPRGYSVVRHKVAPGAAYVLYDDNDNRTDGAEFLYLRTVGASVTVDLMVF